jgi:hypothetical protein
MTKITGREELKQTIKKLLLHYLREQVENWINVKMADRIWVLSAIF